MRTANRERPLPARCWIGLERMKTDGRIFGYYGSRFDALSNFPVGAHAQVLNVTWRYPE